MTTIRTAQEIRARLNQGPTQPESFSALIVRIAREHEALVDQLHAAASAVGVSENEADALLVEEIEAGPAST